MRETERQTERVCVCVCVCERERERKCEIKRKEGGGRLRKIEVLEWGKMTSAEATVVFIGMLADDTSTRKQFGYFLSLSGAS